jgi:hypothetical protein
MTVDCSDAGDVQPDGFPRTASPRAEGRERGLRQEFITAVWAWEQLTPYDAARAVRAVEELRRIRSHIHARAQRLGYARRCKEALPSCMGECCKQHFPRDLKCVDLLVAICGRTGEEARALSCRIADAGGPGVGCPLLGEHGCLFSFEDRPIVCANAYPCFATREYWEFLQGERPGIEALYETLHRLLKA